MNNPTLRVENWTIRLSHGITHFTFLINFNDAILHLLIVKRLELNMDLALYKINILLLLLMDNVKHIPPQWRNTEHSNPWIEQWTNILLWEMKNVNKYTMEGTQTNIFPSTNILSHWINNEKIVLWTNMIPCGGTLWTQLTHFVQMKYFVGGTLWTNAILYE